MKQYNNWFFLWRKGVKNKIVSTLFAVCVCVFAIAFDGYGVLYEKLMSLADTAQQLN